VVDTLARSMGAGDENSTQDMNAMVRNFDRLRVATGCHVMVVHHSGKNKAAGARGSSALRAATDTEIEIAERVIEVKKQRSHTGGNKISFDLRNIDIGQDADGDRIASCVVVLRVASEFADKEPLTPLEQSWFDAMDNATDVENNDDLVFTIPMLRLIWSEKGLHDSKIHEATARARIVALVEKSWIKKIDRGQWVIANRGVGPRS